MKSLDNSVRSSVQVSGPALPRPFRLPSVRELRGPVPEHFEQFYRDTLRFRPGGRVRSLEVKYRYDAWARENAAPEMHERQIKRAMLNIGHTHFRSNHCFFGHLQLAAAAPDLDDNFPDAPAFPQASPSLVDRIDRIGVELEQLRREVEARGR